MANLSAADIQSACQTLAALADTTPIAGGTLTINGNSLGSYDYVKKTGNQTVSSFLNSDWFTATADSVSAFVIVNGDLTINAGQVFQPANRKLFTAVYVTGNLIVNGQIAMDARGANHSSSGSNIAAADILIASTTIGGVTNPKVPAAGSSGGTGVISVAGNPGADAANGGTAGGGSGADRNGGGTQAGSAGTSFSGGPGGGGNSNAGGPFGSPPTGNGGAGGAATGSGAGGQGAGGGAGNPGGAGATAAGGGTGFPGDNGTGGTLIIICLGTYSGSGTVTSAGAAGGNCTNVAAAASGAGSGGGSLTILCLVNNNGPAPTALGGPGGTNAVNPTIVGGRGGNGSVRVLAQQSLFIPFNRPLQLSPMLAM